jgi:hypothetical protein
MAADIAQDREPEAWLPRVEHEREHGHKQAHEGDSKHWQFVVHCQRRATACIRTAIMELPTVSVDAWLHGTREEREEAARATAKALTSYGAAGEISLAGEYTRLTANAVVRDSRVTESDNEAFLVRGWPPPKPCPRLARTCSKTTLPNPRSFSLEIVRSRVRLFACSSLCTARPEFHFQVGQFG